MLRGIKLFLRFFSGTIRSIFPPYCRSSFYYKQFLDVGIKSVPIVLIVGAFVGMVLAVMTYKQFSKLGIESLVGPFIAVPMVSQLGPIMTALMILCRVGSAMTAELGTMRVTEQIDALHCFGINPMKTLIAPRVIVCAFFLPALTIISDIVGILAGWLLSVHFFDINSHFYIDQTKNYFEAFDIFTGIGKAFFFGIIISVVCCYKGFFSKGGASGVGKSIMEAVVISFIMIIVSNFCMSLITQHIWHNYVR